MLAADGPDAALAPQVVAQLGERPATERQADLAGRLVGQAHDGGLLGRAQASSRPTRWTGFESPQAAAIERMQVGIDGVGMNSERGRDVAGGEALGVQQDRLRAAPGGVGERMSFQEFMQPSEFAATRRANAERSRHDEPPPAHLGILPNNR